jgi:hypothetical protein
VRFGRGAAIDIAAGWRNNGRDPGFHGPYEVSPAEKRGQALRFASRPPAREKATEHGIYSYG